MCGKIHGKDYVFEKQTIFGSRDVKCEKKRLTGLKITTEYQKVYSKLTTKNII